MSCCPVDRSLTVHSAPQGSFCKPLRWLPVSGEGMQSQRIWECFPSTRRLSGNGRVCHGDKHTVDTASWTPWHFSWIESLPPEGTRLWQASRKHGCCCGPALLCRSQSSGEMRLNAGVSAHVCKYSWGILSWGFVAVTGAALALLGSKWPHEQYL